MIFISETHAENQKRGPWDFQAFLLLATPTTRQESYLHLQTIKMLELLWGCPSGQHLHILVLISSHGLQYDPKSFIVRFWHQKLLLAHLKKHIIMKGIWYFFLVWTRCHPQYRIGYTHLAPKSHLVSGIEAVFFEMEWPGFVPRTSSIRRGRSISTPSRDAAPDDG